MRQTLLFPALRLTPQRRAVRVVAAHFSAAVWLGLLLFPGAASAQVTEPFSNANADRQTWFARWDQTHQSSDGRPIETMQIGRGPFRTLVLGSLHGSEAMAVAATTRLALHLGRMSDHWDAVNVLVVKTPNPDGHAERTNKNSRGVDLNQNFPLPANRRLAGGSPGRSTPFSETETRALRQLIETFRPHRIVHVKSTRNVIGWALCNDRAQEAAGALKPFRNLRVGRLEDRTAPGSVESYATDVLGIEAITLAVPHEPDSVIVWRNYRTALLAATAFVDPHRQHIPERSPFNVSQPVNPPHPRNESFRRRIISDLFRKPSRLIPRPSSR